MATHSSILAWRIPWTEGPDGLLSMGLHRVRHNLSDLAAAAARGASSTLQFSVSKGKRVSPFRTIVNGEIKLLNLPVCLICPYLVISTMWKALSYKN